MGKYYMRRKCRGAAGDSKAAPAVVLGARTRSRAATAEATPTKRRKQAEATVMTTARVEADALPGQEGDAVAGCYLRLRSRKLFMPAASAVAPRGDLRAVVVGISRCSSTASSTMDVAAREGSGGEAVACVSQDVESSVSDSECDGRERRETTPSSRPPVDCSDLESSRATDDQKKHKRRRSPAATTTTTAAAFHLQSRARMPAAAEIEEFFFAAAAEKAQAERFAAKYNFDVALGVPLNAGRFEWTPVATI